jgi:rhodanese-related sulfurtransferase
MFSLFKKTKSLSMNKALDAIQNDSTIKLVDVRTKDEFRGGRIPRAINIPVESLHLITKSIPDKNSSIFVYCFSGSRSTQATILLDKMGYTNVTNIGGIMNYNGILER